VYTLAESAREFVFKGSDITESLKNMKRQGWASKVFS